MFYNFLFYSLSLTLSYLSLLSTPSSKSLLLLVYYSSVKLLCLSPCIYTLKILNTRDLTTLLYIDAILLLSSLVSLYMSACVCIEETDWLFISFLQDKDEGVYTCRVENAYGVDEIQHQISISRPPSSVSLVLGYVTANSIQIHWDPPSRADPPLSGLSFTFFYYILFRSLLILRACFRGSCNLHIIRIPNCKFRVLLVSSSNS